MEAYASQRTRRILVVIAATFVGNLIVAVAKIAAGLWLGLLSLTASGFESLLDTANNVFGFVAVKMSAQEPDHEHPYGHRKFETIAAMLVAILIFIAGSQIFVSAVKRLQGGIAPNVNAWAYGAILLSLAVNAVVIVVESRFGRLYRSEFLKADAAHTLSDSLSGVLVLVALVLVARGWFWADLAVAIVVVCVVVVVGLRIIMQSFSVLTDTVQLAPEEIAAACLSVEGIRQVHKIRSRGTPDAVKVDLHIQVDPHMHIDHAHFLAHQAKHAIVDAFPSVDDVVVHIEPGESRKDESDESASDEAVPPSSAGSPPPERR